MICSPAAQQAFDLTREPGRVRDRYGRNEYGESFLLARRLVEAGVSLVTISWMYIFPRRARVERVGQPRGLRHPRREDRVRSAPRPDVPAAPRSGLVGAARRPD